MTELHHNAASKGSKVSPVPLARETAYIPCLYAFIKIHPLSLPGLCNRFALVAPQVSFKSTYRSISYFLISTCIKGEL